MRLKFCRFCGHPHGKQFTCPAIKEACNRVGYKPDRTEIVERAAMRLNKLLRFPAPNAPDALVIALIAIGVFTGCAVKKPVLQPLIGPVTAHYNLSDCKPMPNFQPGLDCRRVQLTPLLLPVSK